MGTTEPAQMLRYDEVACSFKDGCVNYKTECHKCKWNSNNHMGDYLVIRKGDKRIHFLNSTQEQDLFMWYGEVPPHNIKTIDNYIISC